jgi:glutamate/tyrosine decarboxylase-like PLP-dependent enzyme
VINPLVISSKQFHDIVLEIAELTTDYLRSLDSLPTFPQVTGAQTAHAFGGPAPDEGLGLKALDSLRDVLAFSRPPSPRFFGYVLGSGEPVAATADLLASVLNQNLTAWRSGPAAIAIERTVVNWIATAIGCTGFGGSLTGGGSSANTMALAMAREVKLPANEVGAQPGIIYASSEVHMSIPKAMALIGLGRHNLRLIPVDGNFQMDLAALRRAVEEDQRAGKKAIAIVGTGGTTNTGAVDDLRAIARVAHEHGLWFHVDGAYGVLAALAAPEKFHGLELADSVSLDPHKWLYQPLDCGLLLYRDSAIARQTFSYSGDYTKSLETDPLESFCFFEESQELSRRFRALKVWLSLRYHGLDAFRKSIQMDLDHAQLLAGLISQDERLELLAPVPLSAVCWRWRSGDDAFNTRLLKQIIQRGRVYISNATIKGRFALRACCVNHRTTEADIRAIVEETILTASELRGC